MEKKSTNPQKIEVTLKPINSNQKDPEPTNSKKINVTLKQSVISNEEKQKPTREEVSYGERYYSYKLFGPGYIYTGYRTKSFISEDPADGYGTITYLYDGERYEGEWKEGKKHGYGIHILSNGERYEGEWKEDEPHGRGIHILPDNHQYEGEWKEGKKDGYGIYDWFNGDRYEGDWKNGKKHGRGTLNLSDGQRYECEWIEDKKHGHGTFSFLKGERYEGEWKEGKKDGHGIYICPNGNEYEGDWKNGKKHGRGTLNWINGHKYKGEWKEDEQHGHGIYIFPNEYQYEGEWKEGKKDGKGIFIYNDDNLEYTIKAEWKDDFAINTDELIVKKDKKEEAWSIKKIIEEENRDKFLFTKDGRSYIIDQKETNRFQKILNSFGDTDSNVEGLKRTNYKDIHIGFTGIVDMAPEPHVAFATEGVVYDNGSINRMLPEVEALLIKKGFKIKKTELIDKQVRAKNEEGKWEFVTVPFAQISLCRNQTTILAMHYNDPEKPLDENKNQYTVISNIKKLRPSTDKNKYPKISRFIMDESKTNNLNQLNTKNEPHL